MGESLTCTCLLSIHGTLGEYDVNIKTQQEHLEDNLEQTGIFMIACHSHKLTFAKSTCTAVCRRKKFWTVFFFFKEEINTNNKNPY